MQISYTIPTIKQHIDMQKELQTEPVVPLRIGMHIGEVLFEEGKIFGDGVNLASRIQSLGLANTILFSEEIHNKIKNNPEFKSASLGSFEFKNVEKAVEVFVLMNEGLSIPLPDEMEGKLKKKIPVKSNIFRKMWKSLVNQKPAKL